MELPPHTYINPNTYTNMNFCSTQMLNGATQKDPVRYCIDWDLLPRHKKYVRFTAKAATSPKWATIREWVPPSEEVAKYWNEPLRAIFTFW